MVRKSSICACGDHGWVVLTSGYVSLFDPEYVQVFDLHKWFAKFDGKNWYACRSYHQRLDGRRITVTVRQHQVVMPLPYGTVADHKNGNGLDNRRANLRIASASQNAANQRTRIGTSRFRGVSRAGEFWRAVIGHGGRQTYLGKFAREEDAARAYDDAAASLHGEFCRVNFPDRRAS